MYLINFKDKLLRYQISKIYVETKLDLWSKDTNYKSVKLIILLKVCFFHVKALKDLLFVSNQMTQYFSF